MLGHNVWLIRFAAFVLAGFWGSVAGVLYVWDFGFISPQTLSLQQSAETLLMVVLGGAGTIAGPIVGAIVITVVKTVVSSYVDRWATLLGTDLHHLGDAVAAGHRVRLAAGALVSTAALEIDALSKRFGGVVATRGVSCRSNPASAGC